MKLVEMKCKNCGAKLKVDSEKQNAHCEFCGVDFKIDDEVKHIKYDDMEQSGYEFEKGKIRAREEAKQEKIMIEIILNWFVPFILTGIFEYIAKNLKKIKNMGICILNMMLQLGL